MACYSRVSQLDSCQENCLECRHYILQLLDSSVQYEQSPPLIVATCSKHVATVVVIAVLNSGQTSPAFSKSPIFNFLL